MKEIWKTEGKKYENVLDLRNTPSDQFIYEIRARERSYEVNLGFQKYQYIANSYTYILKCSIKLIY